jgi:hypothetical protein
VAFEEEHKAYKAYLERQAQLEAEEAAKNAERAEGDDETADHLPPAPLPPNDRRRRTLVDGINPCTLQY